jgi:hypothetical protein
VKWAGGGRTGGEGGRWSGSGIWEEGEGTGGGRQPLPHYSASQPSTAATLEVTFSLPRCLQVGMWMDSVGGGIGLQLRCAHMAMCTWAL